MEFRERLYQLRRKAGLSQEELANLMGVSRQAVQKWESGASKPDMDNLSALADYFQVSLDYLIRGWTPPVQTAVPTAPVPWRYEYKSPKTLFGLPLVHIHIGYGFCCARGIVAIGNYAIGAVALGSCSAGLLSLGGIAAGGLALGGVALGGIALGGLAVGLLAFGGAAIGLLALGGVAMGHYAAGASAVGSLLAVGHAAASPLAEIGAEVSGQAALSLPLEDLKTGLSHTAAQIAPLLPDTPDWIVQLLLRFGSLL